MPRVTTPLIFLPLLLTLGHTRPPDELDALVRRQMARRQIPGLSLVVIKNGTIADARAYGTTLMGGGQPVTTATLFQAGSISKPVTAFAALRLVEAGQLSLDEDVNARLKSWKLPPNEFTAAHPVTLRHLLSHTGGTTVPSFPGYRTSAPLPTLLDVLEGRGNTPPVRVTATPGTVSRYSGGGYAVVQQLLVDASGEDFATLMRERVLQPVGMTNSTYEQPLPRALQARAASGYHLDGVPVEGGWRVHPEQAAAGLWTTPSDLARLAIEVQRAAAGRSGLLSAGTAKDMLTLVLPNGTHGLGFGVGGTPGRPQFSHGGRNEGFDAVLIAYVDSGDGIVVMMNRNDNSRMTGRIIDCVFRRYGFPDQPPAVPPIERAVVAPAELGAIAGRYDLGDDRALTLLVADGALSTEVNGLPDEEFVPTSDGRFVSTDRDVSLRVVRTAQGAVEALEWTVAAGTRRLRRLGP